MRKILSAFFCACLILLSAPSVFAQDDNGKNYSEDDMPQQDSAGMQMAHPRPCIAFGVEAGLNISNYIYGQSENDGVSASDPIFRGRAGAILDIPIHGIFYIQPGIFYAMNGSANTLGVSGNTWNVNTLEIPANLILKFGKKGPVRYFVGAGPYAGYNISGTYNNNGSKGSLEIGTKSNDNLQPVDVGFGINAGIELTSGWLFRLRYQQGITDLKPYSGYATSINSVSYGVQVGYIFGRKCRDKGPKLPQAPEQRVWDQ